MPEFSVDQRTLSLQIDGESPHVERHSPQDIDAMLRTVGRDAIITAIETSHERVMQRNPDPTIIRPNVGVITLATPSQRRYRGRVGSADPTFILTYCRPIRSTAITGMS